MLDELAILRSNSRELRTLVVVPSDAEDERQDLRSRLDYARAVMGHEAEIEPLAKVGDPELGDFPLVVSRTQFQAQGMSCLPAMATLHRELVELIEASPYERLALLSVRTHLNARSDGT